MEVRQLRHEQCEDQIKELKRYCNFTYTTENGYCKSIAFPDHIFESSIRHHPEITIILNLISQLTQLESLDLRKARINQIPQFKSKILKHIDLSCNNLEYVPQWILEQTQLKYFNIGANKLIELPKLDHLPLETLKLHKNINLKSIPKLSDSIKHLNLFLLPNFSEVPKSVLELNSLEVFAFGQTKMNSFIPVLSNLKWLNLTLNEFKIVPKSLNEMQKLEGLILAKNKIEKLPEIELPNLKFLSLYGNNISKLPESFFKLKLEKLNLYGNPLDPLIHSSVENFEPSKFP